MELLIAIGIGVVIVLTAVSSVSVSLQVASQDPTWQGATFLGQQLLDNVAVTAEGNWPGIAAVTNESYLEAGSSGFTIRIGRENLRVNNTSYERYFTVAAVERGSGGEIVDSGGADDPSTKKITVTVQWRYRGQPTAINLVRYVTRSRNTVFAQTDWVGGPTCPSKDEATASAVHTRFCKVEKGDLDFQSRPGSIKIRGY